MLIGEREQVHISVSGTKEFKCYLESLVRELGFELDQGMMTTVIAEKDIKREATILCNSSEID